MEGISMNDLEKRLAEEKRKLSTLKAPDELEAKLKNALDQTPNRKRRVPPLWNVAAAAILLMILVGYNYNAFAFYGKKMLGFDEVINGTLQHLNEEGMGQIIEKQMTLADGTELTIDGIMSDANQMIVYYTLANDNGIEDVVRDSFQPRKITGFLTNSHVSSGVASMNEEGTLAKGTFMFDPASAFSKKLTLHFWERLENGQLKETSLTFPYNPNKAMQTQVKQSIKKTLTVDKGKITFDAITATPTLTVIKGTMNVANHDRVSTPLHGIELIANGEPVEILGSGTKSGVRGYKFDIRYDALPKDLESLQLVMKKFVGYQTLNEKLSINKSAEQSFKIGDKQLDVKNISTSSQTVEITISTDEDVMLDGVSIETGSEITPLKTTVNQDFVKEEDGRILKVRTIVFETTDFPDYLIIEGMHYTKEYNQIIDIPVN